MVYRNLVLALLSVFAIGATTYPASAQQSRADGSWLDRPLVNWNRRMAALPAPVRDAQYPMTARCREQARPAASAGERALVRRGWTLIGAVQSFGTTRLITATAGFDGMCRPWGHQAFVYVEGRYAGTLAPVPMYSRLDGSMTIARLFSPKSIAAEFARYGESDARCCPSRTSTVSYTIRADETPEVKPTNVSTEAICRTSGQTDSGSDSKAAALFGKRWVLTEIGEQRLRADKPFIEFDREAKRVSGDGGCNRFSGGFEITGTSLKLSRLASTRRACLSPAANRLETSFLRLLETTTRFEIQGDTLRLYANDSPVLVFTRR